MSVPGCAALIVVLLSGDGVLPGGQSAHGGGPAPHRLQAYLIHHKQHSSKWDIDSSAVLCCMYLCYWKIYKKILFELNSKSIIAVFWNYKMAREKNLSMVYYRSQGFWMKEATYTHQPTIHFTNHIYGNYIKLPYFYLFLSWCLNYKVNCMNRYVIVI